MEPPVIIRCRQPSTSPATTRLLSFPLFFSLHRDPPFLPVRSRTPETQRGDTRCCRVPFQFLAPEWNKHSASCRRRRQRLDVITRPQLFPGRQQAEPRLTSILSCTCGSSPLRQTHFVRDPLPITTLLRNALGIPFQNFQRLHMNFTSFTFPVTDPSEAINAVKRRRKDTDRQNNSEYLLIVFSFRLKLMLTFTHRIIWKKTKRKQPQP